MPKDVRGYDPMKAPDPEWWLLLSEDDRNGLVLEYHRLARVEVPNATLHAAFHVIVETQAAMGDELPVARTLARLQIEGLDRHDAVHAIGSPTCPPSSATHCESPPHCAYSVGVRPSSEL